MKRLPFAWPCLCVALLAAPGRAAGTPADELLRYVPPDVSFCFVLRDLRGHTAALESSPFVKNLARSPLGPLLRKTPGLQDPKQIEALLELYLGMNSAKLREDILGDAVVLAYRGGPPGKPDQDQGLLLVRAREPKSLATLVERLNKTMKDAGLLKEVVPVKHGGFTYFRRVGADETSYYYVRDGVLLFSAQEEMLQQALALEGNTPAKQEAALVKTLRQLGVDRAMTTFWINPRAFDAELENSAAKAPAARQPMHKTFLASWKAIDGVAFTLDLTRDLEFGLSMRGRPKDMPSAVRNFLKEASRPADVLTRFPEDALLAAGARTPALALLDLLGAFQTKKAFEGMKEGLERNLGAALGRNLVRDVLPHVGPDWGLCITAPPRGEKPWFPSVVFALRVGAGDVTNPADRAMFDVVDFFAKFLVFGYNKTHENLLEMKRAGQEMRYLASPSGLAMGLQPTFGVHDGYLVLASSPESFRRFAAARPTPKKASEVMLLRIHVAGLRAYLKDREESVAASIAEQSGQPAKEVAKQIHTILLGLALIDRVELSQRTAPNQVAFTLRVRPASSLKK
jgi:hypothetical protein